MPLTRRFQFVILLLAVLCGHCAGGSLRRAAAEFNGRGAAQLSHGDLDAAEASFHLALEYNDRYAEPWNNLGLVALARGRVHDARRYFRRAVALNSDFGEAWSNLGIALWHDHSDATTADVRAAADAFSEAIMVDPRLINARVNLCRALLTLHDSVAALDQARRAVQVDPSNATAWALRAEAALALQQWDEAFTSAVRAHRGQPFSADITLTTARAAAGRGDFATALSLLQQIENHRELGAVARTLARTIRQAQSQS
jgi:Tfp pilus assembly protein PilF